MLNLGSKLGPYEIVSLIGAGGMGEVYKARDTRLERTVAIKVLSAHLADRPEVRERFEREARTIAGLNHPHICTLHDVGRQDGIDFLVMEYVEGETLAMRLLKGPLPPDQVLRYAIEIADALDKAHRNGVTHRDLKPGNVMLTRNGAKLLDFGLAKLKQDATPQNLRFSQLPTVRENPTVEGTILGTLQYMAPEQVEGRTDAIDGRTDIFAFGALVYEMATGKKAFEGKSTASLFAKILEHDPPPISSLQSMTPQALDRVVKRCLAKEPDDRWQTASDLSQELKWIAEGGSQATHAPVPAAVPTKGNPQRALLAGAAALGLLVLGGVGAWVLKPTPAPAALPVTRFTITLPKGDELAGLPRRSLAISPDGRLLAYFATRGGVTQLFLRAIDALDAKPVPGTEDGRDLFFSPDSQWLGFGGSFSELKKVAVTGGTAITLSGAPNTNGAVWTHQDTIILEPTQNSALQQVSDTGGTMQAVTRLETGETSHRWPDLLPGDKAVLFAGDASGTRHVAVYSMATGKRQDLVEGTSPRYAPSGHLLYSQAGTVMAAPFDPQTLAITGRAVPAIENVLEDGTSGVAQYGVSNTGTLVYVPGGVQSLRRRLVWVTRNGVEQPVAAPPGAYVVPRISPDGTRIAVDNGDTDREIWLYDLKRDTLTRLTSQANASIPLWSPDGQRIAFRSVKGGRQSLSWQPADGSGGPEELTTGEEQYANSFSPDGKLLSYYEVKVSTGRDLWVLNLGEAKNGAQSFLQTPANEAPAKFSPDGHWIVYTSTESGRNEVYVRPYPGPGGKSQVSTEGGVEPAWNPNGRELFYRNGDKMMAVDTTTQPNFVAGKPKMLFQGKYVIGTVTGNYDVSPDGQRFLMLKEGEESAPPSQINVVLNWLEELKRLTSTAQK